MIKTETKLQVYEAVQGCLAKKAEDLSILQLDASAAGFTDYFVICSGANQRQNQAIADEVQERLERMGARARDVEGYNLAEWVLIDFVDFIVHIFSRQARSFYDLERLWRTSKHMKPEVLRAEARKRPARAAAPTKAAKKASRPAAKKKAAPRKPARAAAKRTSKKK